MSASFDMFGKGKTTKERRAIRVEKLKKSGEEKDAGKPASPPVVEIQPNDEKLSLLKCICCKKIPFPTQHSICEAGHIICNCCAATLKRCPSEMSLFEDENSMPCNREVARVFSPLALFEAIYKEGLWRCANFENGCMQNLPGDEIVSHAQTCEYRSFYSCVIPNCGAGLDSAAILSTHLRRSHSVPSADAGLKTFHVSYDPHNCSSEATVGMRFPQLLEFDGTNFLVVVEEHKKKVKISLWHYGDGKEDPDGFQCQFILHGKHASTLHKEWIGLTVQLPNRTSQSQMPGNLDETTCFTIKRKDLERSYLKKNKKVLYWTAAVLIKTKLETIPNPEILHQRMVDAMGENDKNIDKEETFTNTSKEASNETNEKKTEHQVSEENTPSAIPVKEKASTNTSNSVDLTVTSDQEGALSIFSNAIDQSGIIENGKTSLNIVDESKNNGKDEDCVRTTSTADSSGVVGQEDTSASTSNGIIINEENKIRNGIQSSDSEFESTEEEDSDDSVVTVISNRFRRSLPAGSPEKNVTTVRALYLAYLDRLDQDRQLEHE